MINVTKTFLPPQLEYQNILKRAWDSNWITNRGKLVVDLEEKLRVHLEVSNILITNNGTIPLQIALKLFGGRGDIITTPFSYVATTSSIIWEGCNPVFVDIDPDHLTIDETKIEAAITSNTTAILATHVFGNPCDVETISEIAEKHNLMVIYDAAHCFGVTYKEQSVFNYGDISTCSFHATKLFHTGEGGAIFCNNEKYIDAAFYSHNFGHDGPEKFHGLGINGKISELQAAMGLAVLPYMNDIIKARKKCTDAYNEGFEGIDLQLLKIRKGTTWNYSYYPVIFKSEKELIKVKAALNALNIFPRRYFYPSLNQITYVDSAIKMPISESISSKVICLPLYVGLEENELSLIINVIKDNLC